MTYSEYRCLTNCFETISMDKCKCNSNVHGKHCTTVQQGECHDRIYKIFQTKSSPYYNDCIRQCPKKCQSLLFLVKNSYNQFPTNYYAEHLIRNSSAFAHSRRAVSLTDVRRSVLRLKIYYEHLDYQLIEEKASISINEVIANFGGFLGLFMGMSYLSFIEFIEIGFELIAILLE